MKQTYPFLELMPEYLQSLMIDLVLDFTALLILAMLIIHMPKTKESRWTQTIRPTGKVQWLNY